MKVLVFAPSGNCVSICKTVALVVTIWQDGVFARIGKTRCVNVIVGLAAGGVAVVVTRKEIVSSVTIVLETVEPFQPALNAIEAPFTMFVSIP